jgi:hypothetical protein
MASLVVILTGLLAVMAAPATARAAALPGTRVSASAFSAPSRTGPPFSLVADRQLENGPTYDGLAVGVPVATEAATEVGEEGGSALQDLAENCLTAGGQSFSAGSQVVLASGATVAISQLWPGTQVLATNPQTGKTQAETVDKVWVNHDTALMDVVVRTAAGTGTIDSTAHHLFWDLTTKAWTEADHLQAGDRLWTPDGQLAAVARLVPVPGSEDMWDLTVANDHDFYVVTVNTAILVHNCPAGENPFAAAGRAAHAAQDYGPGWAKEVTLENGQRVDAINMDEQAIAELKPDNLAAITRGANQLSGYIDQAQAQFGGDWSGYVVTYDPADFLP